MLTSKMFAPFFLLALAQFAVAQTPPTAYTIVQTLAFPPAGSTQTIYRSGSKVLTDIYRPKDGATPASHNLTLYDTARGISWAWNPGDANVPCNANHFSGDWGDPYASGAEFVEAVKKGDLKPAGAETISGTPAKIFDGVSNSTHIKAWFDEKNGLVLRLMIGAPGSKDLQPLINITKVTLAPPAASLFNMPAICAGVKPPPTPAELIAEETGDDAANWVNANLGPGSKNSCSILVHVVAPKTMAPLNRKFQAAIDTTYDPNNPNPPGYTFGVGDDGTSTYSGGGLHEITNQVRNFTLRIDNPPAAFSFGINVPTPHYGATTGLIYRQCFAPVTNLFYIVKDPSKPGAGGDYLYAKSGKYATAK